MEDELYVQKLKCQEAEDLPKIEAQRAEALRNALPEFVQRYNDHYDTHVKKIREHTERLISKWVELQKR